jgi:hypothetical protein
MSGIYSIFNISVPRPSGRTDQGVGPRPIGQPQDAKPPVEDTGEQATVGAFITPQSLVSFTGATGAISIIWGTIGAFLTVDAVVERALGLAISLIVGFFIYWINVSDPQAVMSGRDKKIAIGIAFLNSLVLFVASFGAQAAMGIPPATGQ